MMASFFIESYPVKNMHNIEDRYVKLNVLHDHVGRRVDCFLSDMFVQYTRSFFKQCITAGHVLVNERRVKAGYILKHGDIVSVFFPVPAEPKHTQPFDDSFGVKVVAQEDDFLILYKPPGLMVHKPNHFSEETTLVDWLLASYKDIVHVGVEDRPGIVHRLDRDTSGLLIVPRTNEAHGIFGELFRRREVEKIYWALVHGHPDRDGAINYQIGRDPVHKHRMKHFVCHAGARDALTYYKVLDYYDRCSLLELRLVTGRTHQIRVHCAAIGHPVYGDRVYGEKAPDIERQALHAKHLSFVYKGRRYEYDYPVPEDMQLLIDKFRV
jgi:23S rRNA pseudouridine1911/1915/1917 synthase